MPRGSAAHNAKMCRAAGAFVRSAGAAGGLAGGLAALGATLVPGFDLVADELGLHDALDDADLVITGEGRLDAQSFDGKVVGGVAALAAERGVPVAVITGVADADVAGRLPTWSLVDLYGDTRALAEPQWCVQAAAGHALAEFVSRPWSS